MRVKINVSSPVAVIIMRDFAEAFAVAASMVRRRQRQQPRVPHTCRSPRPHQRFDDNGLGLRA